MKLGLRPQLILALAGLFALAFVPLFFAVASLTRATLRAEREAHARAMGRVVAARLAEAQASRRPGELLSLVDAQIGASSGVRGIAIYDSEGRSIVRAGDPEAAGVLPERTTPGEERVEPLSLRTGRALEVVVPGARGAVATVVRTDDEAARVGPLLRLVGFYTLFVALALLLFVYFSLTRLVVQPVVALSRSASRVASGGRLLEPPSRGAAELLELGQSLGEMTERLRGDEEALRSKIAELERTASELRAAQGRLIRSERLASVGRLAAGLAHEVGNPLAALMGLQDLLIEGGLTEEEQRDFVVRMRRETERIHRIVRDLLDYARPASARVERASEPGSVRVALDDLESLLRPQKAMRDVTLTVELAPDLPAVALSHEHLVQLSLNLVSNAADAMEGRGQVWVRARRADDTVVLEVEDDGPGVDPSVAHELFEPFVTTKDVGEGTGLGLAVCRGLVEGAGGSISHAPREGGLRGARFIVHLPVAAPSRRGPVSSASSSI